MHTNAGMLNRSSFKKFSISSARHFCCIFKCFTVAQLSLKEVAKMHRSRTIALKSKEELLTLVDAVGRKMFPSSLKCRVLNSLTSVRMRGS